jgi:hypothetical protein
VDLLVAETVSRLWSLIYYQSTACQAASCFHREFLAVNDMLEGVTKCAPVEMAMENEKRVRIINRGVRPPSGFWTDRIADWIRMLYYYVWWYGKWGGVAKHCFLRDQETF